MYENIVFIMALIKTNAYDLFSLVCKIFYFSKYTIVSRHYWDRKTTIYPKTVRFCYQTDESILIETYYVLTGTSSKGYIRRQIYKKTLSLFLSL